MSTHHFSRAAIEVCDETPFGPCCAGRRRWMPTRARRTHAPAVSRLRDNDDDDARRLGRSNLSGSGDGARSAAATGHVSTRIGVAHATPGKQPRGRTAASARARRSQRRHTHHPRASAESISHSSRIGTIGTSPAAVSSRGVSLVCSLRDPCGITRRRWATSTRNDLRRATQDPMASQRRRRFDPRTARSCVPRVLGLARHPFCRARARQAPPSRRRRSRSYSGQAPVRRLDCKPSWRSRRPMIRWSARQTWRPSGWCTRTIKPRGGREQGCRLARPPTGPWA